MVAKCFVRMRKSLGLIPILNNTGGGERWEEVGRGV